MMSERFSTQREQAEWEKDRLISDRRGEVREGVSVQNEKSADEKVSQVHLIWEYVAKKPVRSIARAANPSVEEREYFVEDQHSKAS